ncbi:MAG TPA: type II toxin-antitoxin system RelE/ParE family toxin [Prolixibacteraceae bacterium]
MKSGYSIDWTVEALNNLEGIIGYLTNRWTDREISNFYKLLDKRLEIISKSPHTFPDSELKTNVKRSVLSKQTTVYFEVKTDKIVILSLFDNRKNPESLKI